MRRFSSGRRSSVPAALTLLAVFCVGVSGPSACKSSGESNSDAGPVDATSEITSVCDEFTEAGAQCSAASSVACFPMCEAGGCFCRVKVGVGPRWVCVTDTTCLPDCAPADESCGAQGDASDAGDAGNTGDAGDGSTEADAAPPLEAGE